MSPTKQSRTIPLPVVLGTSGNDLLAATENIDLFDGGAGTDTVTYASSTSGVKIFLNRGLGFGGFAEGDEFTSIENITGSGRGDTLHGNGRANVLKGLDGDDILAGAGGNDRLSGGNGNDHLTGGTGADVLIGGAGNDWANYYASSAAIAVNLNTGSASGGDAQGDVFTSIENVLGSLHDDSITGNGLANLIYGDKGDDVLRGGDGDDVLRGGAGADKLAGGKGSDWADYLTSSDGVTIDLRNGAAYGGDATGDQLTSIENIGGSDHNDVLSGSNGANVLVGGKGLDTIHGEGGNDRIDGGGGRDFLTGGDGEDRILGGAGNDLIDGGTGRDVIHGGAGNDTIYGGPDPDVICYDFAWSDITATYSGSDYSIWVVAPDGTDHIFTALTIATTTGTYRYDVPTATWVHESSMTGDDWLA